MLKDMITVGKCTLKNRLVMPPMATEKSADGEVTEALIRYYDEMTRGGYLGLVIQEHSFVSPEGKASPNQVSMADDACIEPLKKITEVIHNNGVPVIAQISHAGSAAKKEITGLDAISASSTLNSCDTSVRMGKQALPKEMTRDDINRIIGCFTDAAERARKAGYDGVEIHSAHGYFLDQFYSPLTNKRTDEYTGSTIEGRTKIHAQIIKSVRERCGDDFLISLRWGASDYTEGGAELSEIPEAAKIFTEAGVDMISISGGMCDFFRPGHNEQGWFAELSAAVKSAVAVPVLLTGGITEKAAAEKLLSDGVADLIGVGRAFLKDHKLPEKWMD